MSMDIPSRRYSRVSAKRRSRLIAPIRKAPSRSSSTARGRSRRDGVRAGSPFRRASIGVGIAGTRAIVFNDALRILAIFWLHPDDHTADAGVEVLRSVPGGDDRLDTRGVEQAADDVGFGL